MSNTITVSPRQRMIEDKAARKLNPHTQRSHISSPITGDIGSRQAIPTPASRGKNARNAILVYDSQCKLHVRQHDVSRKQSDRPSPHPPFCS